MAAGRPRFFFVPACDSLIIVSRPPSFAKYASRTAEAFSLDQWLVMTSLACTCNREHALEIVLILPCLIFGFVVSLPLDLEFYLTLSKISILHKFKGLIPV